MVPVDPLPPDPKDDQAGSPPSAADKEPARLQCAADVRILVLDDDPNVCRLIQATFAPHGFHLEAVSDPKRMEAAVRGQPFHVIILDWVLPGLNTQKLIELVGVHQAGASIIVVTAFPSMDSALHCLRAHTYDYIPKPFAVEQLSKTVLRCLEAKGLLRASEEALREQLGAAIRERRKALDMTLADLCKRANLSLGYLSQVELGKSSASIETLYRIALGLGVRLADLFQSIQAPI